MQELIVIVIVIAVVYYIFFRKTTKKNIKNENENEMIECEKCKIYISKDEAIMSNGRYYCSKECLNSKD